MSPSNKFSIIELTIISSLVGQISFKNTGLPSFEVPGDEDRKWRNLKRSKFKSYNNVGLPKGPVYNNTRTQSILTISLSTRCTYGCRR